MTWEKGKWIKIDTNKICPWCQKEFTTSTQRKYCSTTCKNNYNSQQFHSKNKNSLDYALKKLVKSAERKALSWEDLKSLWISQEGKCALSGVEMTYTMGEGRKYSNVSIDRISPGGAYVKDNIRLVCSIVNAMRSDLSDAQFGWWCEQIVNSTNRSFARKKDGSMK